MAPPSLALLPLDPAQGPPGYAAPFAMVCRLLGLATPNLPAPGPSTPSLSRAGSFYAELSRAGSFYAESSCAVSFCAVSFHAEAFALRPAIRFDR